MSDTIQHQARVVASLQDRLEWLKEQVEETENELGRQYEILGRMIGAVEQSENGK